jgi:hypothetical protein
MSNSYRLSLLVETKSNLEAQLVYLMSYRAFESSYIPVSLYPVVGRFMPYFKVLKREHEDLRSRLLEFGYTSYDLKYVSAQIRSVQDSINIVSSQIRLMNFR